MTQYALRWALRQQGVVSALIGVKRASQIDEAALCGGAVSTGKEIPWRGEFAETILLCAENGTGIRGLGGRVGIWGRACRRLL